MALTGLLALLDDITTVLDDVAALSKVAAQKTAGIAGDDLAVNAEGLVGIDPARELPIIGRVALGSVVNKVVLVPLALALPSAAITPLMLCGGGFLCYEGIHKIAHKDTHEDSAEHERLREALQEGPEALRKMEAAKVRQAILTDVVLSAEIVVVALGAVAEQPLMQKAAVLSLVSLGMTAGIYGLVAAIVKIDDVGLWLAEGQAVGSARKRMGRSLVDLAPRLMRVIGVVGTIAMFLVGGGIVLHAVPGAEEAVHHFIEHQVPGAALQAVLANGTSLAAGLLVGLAVVAVVDGGKYLLGRGVRAA